MKQGKILGILFSIASVILIAACIVLFLRADRNAPEFSYQETDVIYREGIEPSELLRGVNAFDGRDGDMTERIVVEKVIENREEDSAIVFYAVSDLSGNAAKSSRVFQAVFDDTDAEKEEESGSFPEAGIDAEMSLSGGALHEEEGRENADDIETLPEDGGQDIGQEEDWERNMPAPSETPTPEPEVPEPTPAPPPTPKPVPTADPAAPILTLKVSEVRVKAGQGPAWVNIIGTLSDDKDGYETLFRNLNVSKYDKDKAGTYGVSVYTEDSDGNRSQSVPLTIIVE